MTRIAGNCTTGWRESDHDGLLPKPEADFADCRECGFEFLKRILKDSGRCPNCEIKIESKNKTRLALALEKFNGAFHRLGFLSVMSPCDLHTAGCVADIAEMRGRMDIAIEIREALYYLNPPVDGDISSAAKPVDCLKPATVSRVGAGK